MGSKLQMSIIQSLQNWLEDNAEVSCEKKLEFQFYNYTDLNYLNLAFWSEMC